MQTTLLDVRQKLFPEQSKTNVLFSFTVPVPQDRLRIHFSYSPKRLDDMETAKVLIDEGVKRYNPEAFEAVGYDWKDYLPLNNLLTLSADCNGVYRGCGHRQSPNQEIVIGPFPDVSDGFYPGPVEKGLWQIAISVHAVISAECDVILTVTGERNDA